MKIFIELLSDDSQGLMVTNKLLPSVEYNFRDLHILQQQ